MRQYFLSKDAFLCESAGYGVFLDLARNKYSAVPPESLGKVRMLLAEDTNDHCFEALETAPAEDAALLDLATELESAGLILHDETKGKPLHSLEIAMPKQSIRIFEQSRINMLSSFRWRFIRAWVVSQLLLRTMSLKSVVERVRSRKTRRICNSEVVKDLDHVSRLAGIFLMLHPRDFSAEDKCLRHSLTLLEFLAQYEIYPDWLFGVRMQPFAAHSWVQLNSTLLNDSIHRVREYTPVMLV